MPVVNEEIGSMYVEWYCTTEAGADDFIGYTEPAEHQALREAEKRGIDLRKLLHE
jgi:hypothetical protein